MDIISVKYANEQNDSVIVETLSTGSVLIALPPHPENVIGGHSAILDWISKGNIISPYIQSIPNYVDAGQSFVSQYYSTLSLLDIKVLWDTIIRNIPDYESKVPKFMEFFYWQDSIRTISVSATQLGYYIPTDNLFPVPPVSYVDLNIEFATVMEAALTKTQSLSA